MLAHTHTIKFQIHCDSKMIQIMTASAITG